MSESSSGVNISSGSLPKTQSSPWLIVTEPCISLPVTCRSKESSKQNHDSGILSPLPSNKFKFRTWHELEGNNIKGAQLHCPRIRTGPPQQHLSLQDRRTSPERKESQSQDTQDQRLLENWENCLEVNLSYQGLGDSYQLKNFYKILHRLIRVEKLQLMDNFLIDLSSVRLPRCKELNLNKNHLTSFEQLPKIPQIQHLSVTENNIVTLRGLSKLRETPIESLTLKRNPCQFQDKYRPKYERITAAFLPIDLSNIQASYDE
ncbi:uncharacterized protein LOC125457735 [Stegostoma tigrinum]|uniref:uncharacterized protein LOC125457735 n=1 Tax=Stegostoma tigrinum TaxID=3053191 RepID=UPI00202B1DB9|nr:uncharacterized protein LOC125457735 [Stegostoma tigrinum]